MLHQIQTSQNSHRLIDHTIRFLTNPRSRVDPCHSFLAFLNFIAYPNIHVLFTRGFFEIRENNWSEFVEPLIRIQISISMFGNNAESEQQIVSSTAVVPLLSMKRHNILLDTIALRNMFNLNRRASEKISERDRSNKVIVWTTAFGKWENGRFVSKLPRQFLNQPRRIARSEGIALNLLLEKVNDEFSDNDTSSISSIGSFTSSGSDSDSDSVSSYDTTSSSNSVATTDSDRNSPHFLRAQVQYFNNDFQNLVSIDYGKRYVITLCKIEPFHNSRETIAFLHSNKYHAMCKNNNHNGAVAKNTANYVRFYKCLMAEYLAKYGSRPSNKDGRYILLTTYRLRVFTVGAIDCI